MVYIASSSWLIQTGHTKLCVTTHSRVIFGKGKHNTDLYSWEGVASGKGGVVSMYLADWMKLVKERVLLSVWFKTSLPLVVTAADEADGTRMGFSSVLSSFRKPTEHRESNKTTQQSELTAMMMLVILQNYIYLTQESINLVHYQRLHHHASSCSNVIYHCDPMLVCLINCVWGIYMWGRKTNNPKQTEEHRNTANRPRLCIYLQRTIQMSCLYPLEHHMNLMYIVHKRLELAKA